MELYIEICEAIRKHFPEHYGDKDNDFIMDYSSHYLTILEDISNNGLSIEESISTLK